MNDSVKECVIEWIRGDKVASITMPAGMKHTNRIRKLAMTREEAEVLVNEDGSIFAHVPVNWIQISPPRKSNMTDEQRAAASERLRNIRKKKGNE